MLGLNLKDYNQIIYPVSVEYDHNPIDSFNVVKALGDDAISSIRENIGYDVNHSNNKDVCRLPLVYLNRLSLEQLYKVRHSSIFMMSSGTEDLLKTDPHLSLLEKIKSSTWRWGYNRLGWNELVNTYECLRNFDLDRPGFEFRLDHTTGFNERGYSKYSRTYLDGVFAVLVYYKGNHVMTLGFSFFSGYKLLLQQVQLKKEKGNRWLYKFGSNYIERVIDIFRLNFPEHQIYTVTGESLYKNIYTQYKNALTRATERNNEYSASLRRNLDDKTLAFYEGCVNRTKEDILEFSQKIDNLKRQRTRLIDLYANIGRFKRGEELTVNNLTHSFVYV